MVLYKEVDRTLSHLSLELNMYIWRKKLYLQVRENKTDFVQKQWELFDCEVYLEEVSDVLCIAYSGMEKIYNWGY